MPGPYALSSSASPRAHWCTLWAGAVLAGDVRGCVGTRGEGGTEGDFDPELLACVNSCLPLFFWADNSSPPHMYPYCSSAKFLFPAPPPILRHSYYAPRCLFALLPPTAPEGAG